MALWVCQRCGCEFAVGIDACPQCTSTLVREKVGDVPKISKHGGATIEGQASDVAEPQSNDDALRVEEPPADSGDGYDLFSKDDLQAELARRELPTTGNKPDLIDRLREDDEARSRPVDVDPDADED